ncbi:MAG: hypothetical protein ABI645_16595 [Pseudomonadota bacterium]
MDHDAHRPGAPSAAGMTMPMGGLGAPMARMDQQMKTMQAMHDMMMQAKTPEQRSALMAEHMKIMQDSMAMMHGTDRGGMMGKGGMGAMNGMGMHDQMMEKRMEMMQSMMQMMVDRLPPEPAKK